MEMYRLFMTGLCNKSETLKFDDIKNLLREPTLPGQGRYALTQDTS